MPLIITPGQLFRRSELYHQLAQLTAAGLPLTRALDQLRRHPPSRSFREPLRLQLEAIEQGYTFAESLQRAGNWLPEFDVALLEAGERSGRLDSCFTVLAEYYADRARMMRQMIVSLLYPIGLLHFAVFILPFAALFTGAITPLRYLVLTFGVLIPLYVIAGLIVLAMQGGHGEVWRSWMEKLLRPVPLLGSGRRELALSRLAMALESLINAGVSIIEAWELAAAVSGSPALRETVRVWRPDVQAGQTPAEALSASGRFPDLFTAQYATGEVSGKLDEVLRRLARYYREEGTRKLDALAQWTPRVAYLLIALMIAYRVVSFYMGYFQQVQNIMGGF